MLSVINDLPNPCRDNINIPIMRKEYDKSLPELIYLSFKGFEIIDAYRILGYEWVPDENLYDPNDHIVRRNTNKSRLIKNMADTRCGVMYLHVEVTGKNKSKTDRTDVEQTVRIVKPLIVPICDENGYYLIKGKKCYLIYQMVDKMLYPSFGAVTIKSLMPICVKTSKDEFVDTYGNKYIIPTYSIQIFKSAINVLLIYSNMTISKTLEFMEVDKFIHIERKGDEGPDDPNVIRFECGKKSDIVVAARKDVFDQEIYVKSIVGCLIKLFEETKIPYDDIDNWEEWMIIVGGKGTVRRGVYQHVFFNRLLDEVTKEELKINDYDKQDIYHLLRWTLQNFQVLWSKDNLSMINKRLRCNEYVGSLITAEISKRINRIVSLGDKATIRDLLNAFKFPEDIFIQRIYASGVLRYAENDSDMDNGMMWAYTAKG